MCKKVMSKEQIEQYILNAASMSELSQEEDKDYLKHIRDTLEN